jgi:hypothetical protein
MTAAMSNPIVKKAQAHGLKNCVLLRRSGQAEDIDYTRRVVLLSAISHR